MGVHDRGHIEGLDEQVEAAKKTGKFDYNATIPGMVALDKYTLRFKLKAVDYLFPYTLAHVPFGAMAREVVEAYGDDVQAHPVGTACLAQLVLLTTTEEYGPPSPCSVVTLLVHFRLA